ERLSLNVVKATALVCRHVRSHQLSCHQAREEVVDFLATEDVRVGAVLPPDADARVNQNRHKKPGLALSKAKVCDGSDLFSPRHCSSSSASRGSMPRPLLPLVRRPPRRAPMARYRVNPARTFAAACAPR